LEVAPTTAPEAPVAATPVVLTANQIVNGSMLLAAGAGAVPAPLWDSALVFGVQIKMLADLSAAYGKPFTENLGRSAVAALLAGAAPALIARGALGSLIKSIPGVGSVLGAVTQPALAAALTLPPELRDESTRQRITPMLALDLLAAVNPGAAAADLTDVVAYLWTDTRADLTTAAVIYATNCAYCHGPSGGGDGFQAATLAVQPTAFADAGVMFLRRGDVLYAKIRRGGMGTDMPNFGVLFTLDETWALVRYLWSLTFARSGA